MISLTSPEFISFYNAVKKIYYDHIAKTYPNYPPEALEGFNAHEGPRYIKICSTRDGKDASAWVFIDRTTGQVLKPASWTAPAKGSRGNIYDEHNGLHMITPYGVDSICKGRPR